MNSVTSAHQFNLHLLGWRAFQDLCATVLGEVWGQTFQVFAPGHDGGRDGAFRGTWTRNQYEALEGTFTVQCKHTSDPGSALTLSLLKEDLDKASELARAGLADVYIVLTNHSITGTRDAEIVQELLARGVRHAACFGAEWLSQRILETPRLRMLVPRVYGLGDLSQILDERAYAQAKQLFHSAAEDLARFVPTAPYRRAAEVLERHGFVCLLGEPGSGKSTIAAALALHSADAWSTNAIRVRHPSEFAEHWNPNDPAQFFWVDDALGALQYQRDIAEYWNRLFPEMAAAIKQGIRIVWTSRSYIFARALSELKISSFPLLRDAQVVVEVAELTGTEKQELLYNHIKLGDQPKTFRSAIKPHLPALASHERLLPEIARRLGITRFTSRLEITGEALRRFVERPTEYLLEVINGLSADERAILIVLFSRGGQMGADAALSDGDRALITVLGGTVHGAVASLRVLSGSVVAMEQVANGAVWSFRHPTMADAVAEYLARDPILVRVYVEATPTEQLLREVTCGDVGVDNVRVVLGSSSYESVARRIVDVISAKGPDSQSRQAAVGFLTYRCDRQFLSVLRGMIPNLLDCFQFGAYLYAVADVKVVTTLFSHGLVHETERRAYVEAATHFAVMVPDAGMLVLPGVRAMFAEQEMTAALARVRAGVVDEMDSCIENEQDNYSWKDDPVDHFSHLRRALCEYKGEFASRGDRAAVVELDSAIERIDKIVARLRREYSPEAEAEWPAMPAREVDAQSSATVRNRFDDVDA